MAEVDEEAFMEAIDTLERAILMYERHRAEMEGDLPTPIRVAYDDAERAYRALVRSHPGLKVVDTR